MHSVAVFHCLLILLPSVLVLSSGRSVFQSMSYHKASTGGRKLQVFKTRTDLRSEIHCAAVCKTYRELHRTCLGFDFHPLDRTCDFYKESSTGLPSPGVEIYQFEATNVFHVISVNNKQFSVYLSKTSMYYSDARQACLDLGAYLLQFDSAEEYTAALAVGSGVYEYSFVGANDLDVEGQWVSDKDKVTGVWIWTQGEPNGGSGENCAILYYKHDSLYDTICNRRLTFFCEKDLI